MLSPENELSISTLLSEWKGVISADFEGYKNHVRRMVTFCLALRHCSEEEQEKVVIAACFHDIGLWTERTLDYIPPSVTPALEYLNSRGLDSWSEEITLMISEHHKLTRVKDPRYPLVEAFRQADLVDVSLGLFTFGLPRSFVRQVKGQIPNAGFHKTLIRASSAWFLRHPLNPVPMMKW